MTFYLTIGDVDWMWRTRVPLMVSRRRLARRPPSMRPRRGPWVLDSGGFTELVLHGAYKVSPVLYAAEAMRYHKLIGNMRWAAIQDWMCEPHMLARTGLTILTHQRKTVASYHRLTTLSSWLPWLPVLQGWTLSDYARCLRMYEDSGVPLKGRVVGIGSICRRQATAEAGEILQWAHGEGLQVHAFGLKIKGARLYSHYLDSSDSMAWSTHASHRPPLRGHTHAHCTHCLPYALRWRQRVLRGVAS